MQNKRKPEPNKHLQLKTKEHLSKTIFQQKTEENQIKRQIFSLLN
jgi:hypothetical protein